MLASMIHVCPAPNHLEQERDTEMCCNTQMIEWQVRKDAPKKPRSSNHLKQKERKEKSVHCVTEHAHHTKCNNCAKICSQCATVVCMQCTLVCQGCLELVCAKCVVPCGSCDLLVCNKDSCKPRACEQTVCARKSCKTVCAPAIVLRPKAPLLTIKTEVATTRCEVVRCGNCTKQCEQCGLSSSAKCMKQCPECGLRQCLSCDQKPPFGCKFCQKITRETVTCSDCCLELPNQNAFLCTRCKKKYQCIRCWFQNNALYPDDEGLCQTCCLSVYHKETVCTTNDHVFIGTLLES